MLAAVAFWILSLLNCSIVCRKDPTIHSLQFEMQPCPLPSILLEKARVACFPPWLEVKADILKGRGLALAKQIKNRYHSHGGPALVLL